MKYLLFSILATLLIMGCCANHAPCLPPEPESADVVSPNDDNDDYMPFGDAYIKCFVYINGRSQEQNIGVLRPIIEYSDDDRYESFLPGIITTQLIDGVNNYDSVYCRLKITQGLPIAVDVVKDILESPVDLSLLSNVDILSHYVHFNIHNSSTITSHGDGYHIYGHIWTIGLSTSSPTSSVDNSSFSKIQIRYEDDSRKEFYIANSLLNQNTGLIRHNFRVFFEVSDSIMVDGIRLPEMIRISKEHTHDGHKR
ncbi:MAG: hypothetical protein V3V00_04690 [Saprospiraceae bacterium]